MTEQSYTDIPVNTGTSNLSGFLDRENDYFRVIDKNFASWSFDGYISTFAKNIVIWDKANRVFNFGPGDYIAILDENDNVSNYQITSVTTDDSLDFFDHSLFPQGKERSDITGISGDGTQIVYTATNSFEPGQRVRISNVLPEGYAIDNALILSADSTTFTVAGTEIGTPDISDPEASVELVSSFTSNVYVNYLDDEAQEKTYVIETILDNGYPVNRLNILKEDWKSKGLGSNGWLLTSAGNAIFNNVAVRGEIEATSGNFLGNLTVNNGTMKIGAGVNRTDEYTISEVVVSSNKVLLTTDSVSESSTFAIGDTIVVSNLERTETGFMDLNGIFTVSYVSATQVGYDLQMPNTGPFTTSVGYVALESANDGIFINENNYWYSDGKLKFGGEANYVSWDNTTLDVVGTVTAESGTIGGWTLNSEEIFSDISDAGNTYRTGIKAPTGLGGGTYTPSIFYMVHDHDTANADPLWADISTPFYVDSNGRFSLSDRFYYNQDIHNASGSTLSIVADAGKIGGSTASDARGWSIGPGFLYSGEGTNYVSLASPGANIPTTDTSIPLNIEKIVVDAEGDNFSTIYIHVQSDDLLTLLSEQTGYTLLELEDETILSEAVTTTFSDKTMKFVNLPGETSPPGRNLFDSEENLQLSSLSNRFLSIRGADIYEVTLSSIDNFNASSQYSTTAYTYLEKKFVLEIYGEDYAYNTEKDEEIVPGVTYQSGGIDLYPVNTTVRAYIDVATASGLYVFWAGDPNPEVASISIDNNGFMSVEDITSASIETGSFVLGGSSVVISDIEPASPTAGDIWIDIS